MALYRTYHRVYDNIPDNNNNEIDNKCINSLAEYVQAKELQHVNKPLYYEKMQNAFDCLKKYGDIYKQLDIELYVLPNKTVIFPDSSRINAHFNIFLRNYQVDPKTITIRREQEKKLKLFDFILHDIYREVYNEFYYSNGFSTSESLKQKTYGIEKLLDKADADELNRHNEEIKKNMRKYSRNIPMIETYKQKKWLSQLQRERERESQRERESITKKRPISIKIDDPLNNVVTFDKPIPIQELEAVPKPNASNKLEYRKSSKSDRKTSKNTQLPLIMAESKNTGGSRKIYKTKRYKKYKR